MASKGNKDEKVTMRAGVLSEAFFLDSKAERKKFGLPHDTVTPTSIVVELNLFHKQGLPGSTEKFKTLLKAVAPKHGDPVLISNTYYRCNLSIDQARALVDSDQEGGKVPSNARSIYRIWPDFNMQLLIDRSVATIKGDAARRSYDATGNNVVWVVIDSGVDASHPHFQTHNNLTHESVAELHVDFTKDDGTDAEKCASALQDDTGHGTHVAGVIAGSLYRSDQQQQSEYVVGQRVSVSPEFESERIEERSVDIQRLAGIAPLTRIISLKVVGTNGRVRSTDVIRALEYVRSKLNGHGKPPLRVHGVNISLGYDFNAKWFACGQSPVCVEVDRLVRSGVTVVVAAGNTGYGELRSKAGVTSTGMSLTINDPGNAALAITVGATHKDSPHTYGVSYFSSKGPTGDGRLKPDLVAPGERIISCATGAKRKLMKDLLAGKDQKVAAYIDDSGTSMAAPHVSGAIAAFLSIRREFIGRPEDVKRIFLDSATSLGRERYFEGHGLLDLMRAIQSV
jgi:subtilisin family serine protease